MVLADTATTNNYMILQLTAGAWRVQSRAGGTAAGTADTGVATANAWHFVVARFISATNRRIDILHPDGSTASNQNTTSRAPAGLDRLGLGCTINSTPAEFFNGYIAEFWVANIDIRADGAALDASLLRQLAYGGPYSVPHVSANLVAYRSLFQSLSSNQDISSDNQDGGVYGRLNWTNTGGATLAPHPPLPGWYQDRRIIRPLGMI